MRLAMKRCSWWITVLAGLACTFIFGLERAGATEVLDQYQDAMDVGFSLSSSPRATQTFRPAFGNVSAISFYVMGPANATLRLFDALCGNTLASGAVTTDNGGWVKVTFASPVAVTPEAEYALEITGTSLGPPPNGFGGMQWNPYLRGRLYLDCTAVFGDHYDATFRTYAEDTLVPVAPRPWSGVKQLYR
jgi:hypothetical protein